MNSRSKSVGVRTKQLGVTLIELMIAISIGLVIAAIAVGTASVVRKDQRASELQQQVVHIATQLQALGKGGSYADINIKVLVDSGKIPAAWVSGDDAIPQIKHPFGGTYSVGAENLNGGTANAANVRVLQVDVGACVSLLNNAQSHFDAIGHAKSGDVRAYGAASLTAAEIVTACNPTDGRDKVDLVLTVA